MVAVTYCLLTRRRPFKVAENIRNLLTPVEKRFMATIDLGLHPHHATDARSPPEGRVNDRPTPAPVERTASSFRRAKKTFRGVGQTEGRGRETARAERK